MNNLEDEIIEVGKSGFDETLEILVKVLSVCAVISVGIVIYIIKFGI